MEITGTIISVLEARSGVSQKTGNAWMSQEFVLETHDQYPRKVCFEVFGEDRIKKFNVQAGEERTVSFDIDAREWVGKDGVPRWTNRVVAWRCITPQEAQQMQTQQAPPPQQQGAPAAPPQPQYNDPAPQQETLGGLPF